MDAWLPNRDVREFQTWIAQRQIFRSSIYTKEPYPGLFSILTPVWEGSPVKYLSELAHSIGAQNPNGECEWVLLDNGCANEQLVRCLNDLSALPWVNLQRAETNVGITGGLRRCLESARGRYVLPVDGDDLLYPDALRVLTSAVVEAGYPPLLYTDEDKVIGTRHYQPYFKPNWDPVLLLNSAYIAHLGVIDRVRGLQLGAYDDEDVEGSPDWDVFIRFLIAGHTAVHIPEIVYSWRVHPASTADDGATKPYISTSQQKVLRRFLEARGEVSSFELEASPLLGPSGHWRFRRREHETEHEFARIEIKAAETSSDEGRVGENQLRGEVTTMNYGADPRKLLPLARTLAQESGFIAFFGENIAMDSSEWKSEAIGITELHPDTVMVGGRIRNLKGVVTEAGLEFGFGGVCGSPNRGRTPDDPGYFGQLWKQRSVSAVSLQLAVMRASFLVELLEELPQGASLGFLGAWAGMYARQTGRRVVYSPFLSAVSGVDWAELADAAEIARFREVYGDQLESKYYSTLLSQVKPFVPGDPRHVAGL